MSYILDALRRADAERSRGAVPGLHAQSAPSDGEPSARNFGPLTWVAGAAGVLLVAVVVVLMFGPWRGASTNAPLAAAPPLAPAAELAPAPLARDAATRPLDDGRAAPADVLPPPPRAVRRDMPADRVATFVPKAAAAAAPPVEHYGEPLQPDTPPAATPAPARAAAIPNINDLPQGVRAQLPRLAVGGAIYSEAPSARMVILNGQVFHEGDKPAPDTVLEQIRLKSAILNFRGQRYAVAF